EVCRQQVAASDVFVGLVGHLNGSRADGEMEAVGMDRLCLGGTPPYRGGVGEIGTRRAGDPITAGRSMDRKPERNKRRKGEHASRPPVSLGPESGSQPG